MYRLFLGVAALVCLATALPAQEIRTEPPEKAGKEPPSPRILIRQVAPDQPGDVIRIWNVQTGQAIQAGAPTPANTNQEIVDLLKQVIWKLEGQNKPQQPMIMRFQLMRKTEGKESPEVEKARAEVKAAEQRLTEARQRLANAQAAKGIEEQQKGANDRVEQFRKAALERKIYEPLSPAKIAELEKRLDRLLQEVEELRRELKKNPPGKTP